MRYRVKEWDADGCEGTLQRNGMDDFTLLQARAFVLERIAQWLGDYPSMLIEKSPDLAPGEVGYRLTAPRDGRGIIADIGIEPV